MPLAGSGIIPSTGDVYNQLTAVTRRAFIPSLVVQIYQATPTLSAALANAQTASGGVSSVTVPVQGTAMTTAGYTDYSGAFDPPSQATGISEADFNLKALVVPIGYLGMEGIAQMNAAVIPIIEARMNDAGNSAAAQLASDLATVADYSLQSISGFPAITTNTNTYGNIANRTTTNTWFAGGNRAEGTVDPTRARVLVDVIAAQNRNLGEMPNMGVCGPGTWSKLAADFVSNEQYRVTPGNAFSDTTQGPGAAFTALSVAGVPIYMDNNWTEGVIDYFNTRYTSFYIHEAAAFAFTGFASTIPNFSLGYVGVLVAILEFLSVKPRSVTRATGYNFDTVTA